LQCLLRCPEVIEIDLEVLKLFHQTEEFGFKTNDFTSYSRFLCDGSIVNRKEQKTGLCPRNVDDILALMAERRKGPMRASSMEKEAVSHALMEVGRQVGFFAVWSPATTLFLLDA
jgi:hypothetical protein